MTNRDSIAKTLGKRLAQKKMANDLTTWNQACRSRSGEENIIFEGLEEIKAHIDPTDFVAFNNYERNLRIFSNFCLNTDNEQNPWIVVNTGDRCVYDFFDISPPVAIQPQTYHAIFSQLSLSGLLQERR